MLSKRASFTLPVFSRVSQNVMPEPSPDQESPTLEPVAEEAKKILNEPIKERSGKLRMDEEIAFIPSIKRDVIKSVHVFLREIKADYPYQISVCISDYGVGGRLGYYDLSYKDENNAKKQFNELVEKIKDVRELIEYNMIPSTEVEKMCKKAVDEILHKSAVFNSSYHGKYSGKQI